MILRSITGTMETTPTAALEGLVGIDHKTLKNEATEVWCQIRFIRVLFEALNQE